MLYGEMWLEMWELLCDRKGKQWELFCNRKVQQMDPFYTILQGKAKYLTRLNRDNDRGMTAAKLGVNMKKQRRYIAGCTIGTK